jgi:hypothetical protein
VTRLQTALAAGILLAAAWTTFAPAQSVEEPIDPSLEALSISDAEVDSLIRAARETEEHRETALRFAVGPCRAQAGLGELRYNRVEGFNAMPELVLSAPTERIFQAFGRVGYGWAAKKPTWQAGLRFQLTPRPGAPLLEVSQFRKVEAYGSSLSPGNTLTAFFLGKDYGDYLATHGVAAGVTVRPGPFRVKLTYRYEHHESLRNRTSFALFVSDSTFRANPPVDELHVGLAELAAQWRDARTSSLSAQLKGISARPNLGSDVAYETLLLALVLRRRLWFEDELVGQVSGGLASGDVPRQAAHHLGGFATLRGYDINEIPALRFAHFRLDYALGSDPFAFVPFARSWGMRLIPFADAAAILTTRAPDGTEVTLSPAAWKFSAGLGLHARALRLRGGTGHFRLDVARRLDRADDSMTYRVLITVED